MSRPSSPRCSGDRPPTSGSHGGHAGDDPPSPRPPADGAAAPPVDRAPCSTPPMTSARRTIPSSTPRSSHTSNGRSRLAVINSQPGAESWPSDAAMPVWGWGVAGRPRRAGGRRVIVEYLRYRIDAGAAGRVRRAPTRRRSGRCSRRPMRVGLRPLPLRRGSGGVHRPRIGVDRPPDGPHERSSGGSSEFRAFFAPMSVRSSATSTRCATTTASASRRARTAAPRPEGACAPVRPWPNDPAQNRGATTCASS